ncbi:MAG: excinuclease ABC subunit UvrC [Spirochaetaceae bacterium]|jgi:excinuclease ABC subunit C|nr:excinuclease ABC subunit UvrC [Spirochaetaceae bacterium]
MNERLENYAGLKAVARDAPELPGCYIMRDVEGRIIYVGKAKVLRNRLSSYFSGKKDFKTTMLVRRICSIETIIVSNEYEALLLENTLIKQHKPRYNIDLKDGKSYPVIRLTAEDFPKLIKTRTIVEDGSRYFGPFANVHALDVMLNLIERLLPLRKCRRLRKRDNPCMYFHIGRCGAPCCGRVTKDEYAAYTALAVKLFEGGTEALTASLRTKMHEAAAALNFERAAELRDMTADIESLTAANSVIDFDATGRDYIAWASEGLLTSFSVFSMRGGKLTGRDLYRTCSAASEKDSFETFVLSYYTEDRPPPAKIYVSFGERSIFEDQSVFEEEPEGEPIEESSIFEGQPIEERGLEYEDEARSDGEFANISRYFQERFNYAPDFCSPNTGDDGSGKRHEAALAMARQNALEDLRKRLKERGAGPVLDELKTALGLRRRPEHIEGFDIAQLDGKYPVASLVAFKNGIPDKKNYRYFRLRTVIGIVDDFAAMREAVRRRYSRLLREEKEMPGLILIDGGIGQVNAARGALLELGLDCDIVGIAKRDEELWLPNASSPIKLSRRSEALKVLQAVRDETHRFATGLNQKLRSKEASFPVLESIDGIGKRRAANLMRRYGSLAAIAEADSADIAASCKLDAPLAKTVKTAACIAIEDAPSVKSRNVKRISGQFAAEPEANYEP